MNIKENLKKEEKKIVTDAYAIALEKQDIALSIVETMKTVFDREAPRKISKEEIADKVFKEIKNVTNEEITEYMNADKKEQPKLRLKIEKNIINNIRQE